MNPLKNPKFSKILPAAISFEVQSIPIIIKVKSIGYMIETRKQVPNFNTPGGTTVLKSKDQG